MLGLPEIILIVAVVLLLFGGKKIPELMKGIGKGVRSFQQGMKGEDEESPQARTENRQNSDDGSAEQQ